MVQYTISDFEHAAPINAGSLLTQPLDPLDKDKLPSLFPFALYTERQRINQERWEWFNGEWLLEKTDRRGPSGKALPKYPLGINPVKNFSRKHASLLLGEGNSMAEPPIRTFARPRYPLDGGESSEEDRRLARTVQRVVNEIWQHSGARDLQSEGATLCQFLGGHFYGLYYEPWRTDLLLPLVVRGFSADHVVPIWQPGNYWRLLEAWVIYVVPAYMAARQYPNQDFQLGDNVLVTYSEHWTEKYYSVYLNDKPIEDERGVFLNRRNPFGFVPFIYVPVMREGSFWGPSLADDIAGLAREFNSRMTDLGDSVHLSLRRKRWASNVAKDVSIKRLGDGTQYGDLGTRTPMSQGDPKMEVEPALQIPETIADFPERIWTQLLRESSLGDVAFGDIDGTQRSSVTLTTLMWPAIARGNITRNVWNEALNHFAKMIIKAILVHPAIKRRALERGIDLPPDTLEAVTIYQEFYPFLPRDREMLLNEIILRLQTHSISKRTALVELGERNPEDEIAEILKDMREEAKIAAEFAVQSDQNDPANQVKTDITTPTASDGLKDER